jgi:hypothetical protein
VSRSLLVLCGVLAGIALTLGSGWALQRWREAGCETSVARGDSGDGRYQARLTFRQCSWGFGMDASFASLRLESSGPGGWFLNEELGIDQPSSAAPSLHWDNPRRLHVTIISEQYSGSLARQVGEVQLLTTYVSPAHP